MFLAGSGTKLQVVDRVEVNTGDSHEYCIRANGGPMTITLVSLGRHSSACASVSHI